MAPPVSVLGLGIPATSPLVPADKRPALQAVLDKMEASMADSPYDWEMFYVAPDMEFDELLRKLREREWGVVMVGMGLRNGSALTVFFERIVNAVHRELPKAKFAFNVSIEETREACRRVVEE